MCSEVAAADTHSTPPHPTVSTQKSGTYLRRPHVPCKRHSSRAAAHAATKTHPHREAHARLLKLGPTQPTRHGWGTNIRQSSIQAAPVTLTHCRKDQDRSRIPGPRSSHPLYTVAAPACSPERNPPLPPPPRPGRRHHRPHPPHAPRKFVRAREHFNAPAASTCMHASR